MASRACNKCGAVKPDDGFYRRSRSDSRDSTCKECRKAGVRANRLANIEYYREYDRARARRPDRVAAREAYQKTENGKRSADAAKARWNKRHRFQRAANEAVNNAVRDGVIQKPSECEECGASGIIHGHHDDYAKPLDVRWLCPSCHRDWHRENGQGLNADGPPEENGGEAA